MASKPSPKESILKFFTPKRKRSETALSPEGVGLHYKKNKESLASPDQLSITIMEEDHKGKEGEVSNIDPDDLTALIASEINKRLDLLFSEMKNKAQEAIAGAIDTVHNMHARVRALEEENTLLKSRLDILENREPTNKLSSESVGRVIHLEQYSRKSNIRIFGMKEKTTENCKEVVAELLNTKLNMDITPRDIDAAHRLPSLNKTAPKPIIVRFVRRDHKANAMQRRKQLKGTGVTIAEDLCKDLVMVMNRAKNHEKIKDTWAWDGHIFIKDFSNNTHKLEYGESVDSLTLPPRPRDQPQPCRPPRNADRWRQQQWNGNNQRHQYVQPRRPERHLPQVPNAECVTRM